MTNTIVEPTTTINQEDKAMSEDVTKPNQQEFIIDSKFQDMLPKLTPAQCTELKESILKEGVRDPVIVWDEANVLLDRHHRNRICEELGIKPPIRRMPFTNRDDAKMWMLKISSHAEI